MGVDFIREQSGKPWRKRWNKGIDRLKIPGLFDVKFPSQQRTVTAVIYHGYSLQNGDQLIIQCSNSSAIVCKGLRNIGEIPGFPADMLQAVSNSGGVALGIVERVGLFGNNAELSIR